MRDKYRVLLPKWVFKSDENEQYALVKKYMQRYPHYILISVVDGFAVCERVTLNPGKE